MKTKQNKKPLSLFQLRIERSLITLFTLDKEPLH